MTWFAQKNAILYHKRVCWRQLVSGMIVTFSVVLIYFCQKTKGYPSVLWGQIPRGITVFESILYSMEILCRLTLHWWEWTFVIHTQSPELFILNLRVFLTLCRTLRQTFEFTSKYGGPLAVIDNPWWKRSAVCFTLANAQIFAWYFVTYIQADCIN